MKFGSGILGVEPPVDGGFCGVALLLQSLDFLPEGLLVGKPLFEARGGQNAELDLRHVQPTAVLGRVMKLQPPGDPPGFLSREGLVQRCPAMGVQIVQDNPYHLGFRVGFICQPAHPPGEVLHRAPLRDRHLSPPRQGLTGQEQVAGTLSPVFVVLAQRNSRPGRQSGTGLCQQLGGGLVKADHGTLGSIGFGVQVQDVIHVGHEVGTHLGDAPLLLLPWLEAFFETLAYPFMGH